MDFILRTAARPDVDALLALWQEAAENEGRPADTRQAVTALLGRADAMVFAPNQLGQQLWRAHGY